MDEQVANYNEQLFKVKQQHRDSYRFIETKCLTEVLEHSVDDVDSQSASINNFPLLHADNRVGGA